MLTSKNPECFGKFSGQEACSACEFQESCRFSMSDDERVRRENSRWEGSFEYNECGAAEQKLAASHDPFPLDTAQKRSYSYDEMIALSSFLLRIGANRKLGKILHEKLMGTKTFSAIAKKEGVTRQAIHKRVGKEMAKLFGFKERRLTDSRLMTLDVREFALLKLQRAGYEDAEIRGELHLDQSLLLTLRKRLDWKLTRPT